MGFVSPFLILMALWAPVSVAQTGGHGNKKVEVKHSGPPSGIKDTSDTAVQNWFFKEAGNLGPISVSVGPNQDKEKNRQMLIDAGMNFSKLPDEQKVVVKTLIFKTDTVTVTESGVTGKQDTPGTGVAGFGKSEQITVQQNVKISDSTVELAKGKAEASFNTPAQKESAKALIVAAVSQALNSPNAQGGAPDGVLAPVNQDGAFASTSGTVSGAGSVGGSPRSKDSIKIDTSSFTSRARELLGIAGRGGFDMAQNPFLSAGSDPAVRSAFQNVALTTLNDNSDPSKDLLGLATTKGFQDTLRNTLGEEQQKDFNLLTAGAALASNPEISQEGMQFAQDLVNSGLSSNELIQASPGLSSLSQSLGGTGLSGLPSETLEWMMLASRLAYDVDTSKLPASFREKREVYVQGYAELKEFLERLKASGGLSLTQEIRVPYEPERARYGWDVSFEKFQLAHREALIGGERARSKLDGTEDIFVPGMKRLVKWTLSVSAGDAKKILKWQEIMNAEASEMGRLWKVVHPTSWDSAQLHASRAVFFASLSTFYAGSKSPVATLVQDAQKWAENLSQERQISKKLRLARQGLDPEQPRAKRAPTNFMKE